MNVTVTGLLSVSDMKISVIIPTLNAQNNIRALLESLFSQTVKAEIIIVDSSSEDLTKEICSTFQELKLMEIERKDFDHGRTRDLALRESKGDFIVFLTQDALPSDEYCLEKLLSSFEDERVAAVYGRQLPYEDAPEHEKLIRDFNYPEVSHVFFEKDIGTCGTRAYFFSDVFSAYRRSAYEKTGGFDHPVRTNEDMLMSAKLLHAGYGVAYNAEAKVFHSHRFTLKEEYERYKKIGQVLKEYEGRLYGSKDNREALKLVFHVLGGLLRKGRIISVFVFLFHMGARYLGSRMGRSGIDTKKIEK